MVQFRLLGPLEALDGERRVELGRPKQRALLAVLLVHANQVVSLDRLIEELWGEEPPPQAAASLQTYVSNLRRALEPGGPARVAGAGEPAPWLPAGGRSRGPGCGPVCRAGRGGSPVAGGGVAGGGRQ